MANLPEKNITTVNKVTSIPSNTNVFINANGEFVQANIDDVVSAGNQFKVLSGSLIMAQGAPKGYVTHFKCIGHTIQNGQPTPENPIQLEYVGNNGTIEVKAINKNQLNNIAVSQTKNGGTITVNEDKSITVNGTFTALTEIKIASNVEVKANEQILSGCPSGGSTTTYEIQLYSSSQGGAIARDFGSGKTTTISGIATAYLIIRSGVTVSNLTFYPMLRPVDTDDSYEPYKESIVSISLTDSLKGNHNGSVTDEIKPTDDVYNVHRKLVELVFDGSDDEGWSGMTTYADRFYIPASKLTNLKPRTVVMCSHYTYSNSLATIDYGIYLGSDLNIKNKDITTLADFKASLALSPVTVIAELAEEVVEEIDQKPFYNLKTFDGFTLISASDNAEMEVEVPMSRVAGVASEGWSKGNLAEIEMQNIKTKLTELQTAVVSA